MKDRSAVWQSGGNSVIEEIDNRLERVRYRRATDQLSWFTAGHILRKFEARTYDVENERRIVLTITGDAKDGEIEPPEGDRDWTEITAQEALTLRESRQLGKWLLARTAPAPFRKLRLLLRFDRAGS
jgi:hypothetical protein